MSSGYGNIHVAIVDNLEFKNLSPEARLIWFVLKLILGPSGIDLLRSHVPAISEMTSYDTDQVSQSLSELEEDDWLLREGDVLWLRNALRFNPHVSMENEKHRIFITKHILALPRLPIVAKFAAYYGLEAPTILVTDTPCDSPSDSLSDTHMKHVSVSEEVSEEEDEDAALSSDSMAVVEVPDYPDIVTDLLRSSADYYSEEVGVWNGANVLDTYVEYGRTQGWPDPPSSTLGKQGAVGKRLANKNSPATIVRAMKGLGFLFPHSKGEPWDLMDLERKFTKAHAAFVMHPEIQRARSEAAFYEALGGC